MEQSEFIKGKWYLRTDWEKAVQNTGGPERVLKYVKFSHTEGNDFCYTERINADGEYKVLSDDCYIENKEEANMLEVSKFLPEGHVDKLVGLPEEYIVEIEDGDVENVNEVVDYFYNDLLSPYCMPWKFIICAEGLGDIERRQLNIPRSYKHLPVFSYNEWIKLKDINMKEEFKLPEFWQIERNSENGKVINDWMNQYHGTAGTSKYYETLRGWVNNKNLDKQIYQQNLPEITFEQFKKYVMKDKKLLGYKCPTDLFGGKVKKGTIYKVDKGNICEEFNTCAWSDDPEDAYTNMPLEIVKTWEPVYEEESINLNFGDTRVTVKKGQGYVSLQEGNITKAELKQIIDHFSKGPKMLGYEGKADKVIYGCKSGLLSELVKIYETI